MARTIKEMEDSLTSASDPQDKRNYFILASYYTQIDVARSSELVNAGLKVLAAASGNDLPKEFCSAHIAGLHRIRMYNLQSLGKFAAANRAGRQSQSLFGKMHDIAYRAVIEGLLHLTECRLNLYDQAVKTLQSSIKTLQSLTTKQMCASILMTSPGIAKYEEPQFAIWHLLGEQHMQLGIVFTKMYRCDSAVYNFLLADNYFRKIPPEHTVEERLMNNNALIKVCLFTKQYSRASKLNEESYQISREQNHPTYLLFAKLHKCTLSVELGQFTNTTSLLNSAIADARSLGQIDFVIVLLLAFVKMFSKQTLYADAAKHLAEAEQLLGDKPRLRYRTDIALYRSRLELVEGRLESSLTFANVSMKYAIRTGDARRECHVHEQLSIVLEKLGRADEALEHYKQFHSIEQAMFANANQQVIDSLFDKAGKDNVASIREKHVLTGTDTSLAIDKVQVEQRGKFRAEADSELRAKIARLSTAPPQDTDARWKIFNAEFLKTNPEFYRRLANICASLTPTELRVSALSSVLVHTEEVANIMGVSTTSIHKYRWRIRRKLNLTREVNLTYFLSGL